MRFLFPVAIAAVTFATHVSAAEIFVSAAASLTDVLKEIGLAYEGESADKVTFNFAASHMLARQIEEGAPADLFISADEEKMDQLQQKKLIVTETRTALLTNSLVFVAPLDSAVDFSGGAGALTANVVRKIALAEPQTVPAGIYAKEYLTRAGFWPKVETKIVPTENVRAALAMVEAGNADVGIVYRTDANISRRVKTTFTVPPEEGPKITYPVAILQSGKNRGAAEKFLAYLHSDAATKLFVEAGFGIAR